jgi:prepilin-type N-terminal cleavage/methylation domain-containing protein
MHRPNQTTRHNRPRTRRRGFTLIEILVVILILSVLVSLVVGVAKTVRIEVARRRTQSIQDQLVAAIHAYMETHNGAPPSDKLTSPIPAYSSGYGANGGGDPNLWAAQVRNADLYAQLISEPACLKFIQNLPPEAVYSPTLPFRGKTGVYKVFRDGFDTDMDYRLTGAGGSAVLISAGPDGHFGGPYDSDNIYSDGRGH